MSFVTENNRRRTNSDFHDAVLRGRKLVRFAFIGLLATGCAWVALESARALSVF